MATEFAKKAFFKGIKWLNVAFAGYEISEITHKDSNNKEIKIDSMTKADLENHSQQHTLIIIAFFIALCLLYTVGYALKITLKVKKATKKNIRSNSDNVSDHV